MFSFLGVWCVVVLCLWLCLPKLWQQVEGRSLRVLPLMILTIFYFILEVSSPTAHVSHHMHIMRCTCTSMYLCSTVHLKDIYMVTTFTHTGKWSSKMYVHLYHDLAHNFRCCRNFCCDLCNSHLCVTIHVRVHVYLEHTMYMYI